MFALMAKPAVGGTARCESLLWRQVLFVAWIALMAMLVVTRIALMAMMWVSKVALMATTTLCDESDVVNTLGRSWSGECAVSIVVPLVVIENDECVGSWHWQCQWRWEGEKRPGEAFISDQRSSDVRLIRGKHWSDVERRVAPGRCLRQVPLLLSE
jgi:hypothetical protein